MSELRRIIVRLTRVRRGADKVTKEIPRGSTDKRLEEVGVVHKNFTCKLGYRILVE